jgi:hypothetical protein
VKLYFHKNPLYELHWNFLVAKWPRLNPEKNAYHTQYLKEYNTACEQPLLLPEYIKLLLEFPSLLGLKTKENGIWGRRELSPLIKLFLFLFLFFWQKNSRAFNKKLQCEGYKEYFCKQCTQVAIF